MRSDLLSLRPIHITDTLSLIKMKKILVAILTIIVLGFVWMNHSKYKKSFDSNKWKEWVESEEDFNLRWQMTGSLTFKHKLKRMNKEEIKRLLGEPTTKSFDNWSYNLGPSGSGINYGSFIIEFKENEVTKYKVIEH